ncbi:tyrosine-type recombinase/integrase [Rhodococcus aetherivorans]|uniref:tyrosine-type recombinase/integrase n=1 Tax=Rhodococcus aetherivorans TaxID=191292 RepID=UPI0021ADB2BD|nr:tyrosine-type recombinase/integrase [Rhodococcus aetherivorans]
MSSPEPSSAPAPTSSPRPTRSLTPHPSSVPPAGNTQRAYSADWDRFEQWCHHTHRRALPAEPDTIATYLDDAATHNTTRHGRRYSHATLTRWVAAINHIHRRAGYAPPGTDPRVKTTLAALRSNPPHSSPPQSRRTAPLLVEDLTTILTATRATCTGWASHVTERRDSAVLLIGFAGALRRSDLETLRVNDVTTDHTTGLRIHTPHPTQPHDGRTPTVLLPPTDNHETCPPCAYARWLHVIKAWDSTGRPGVIRLLRRPTPFDAHICHRPLPKPPHPHAPVFRPIRKNGNLTTTALSGSAIQAMIRRRAHAAGYDNDIVAHLGGHSLRAGFIAQALRNGADVHAIMQQTGHISTAMLNTYLPTPSPESTNAVTEIGL